MHEPLSIPVAAGIDVVSVGALVHRLDPGIVPWRKATTCAIHVSGGEYNVVANLADCFRMKAGIATAMVDYPIGDLIADRVRAMGVVPFYRRFEHNGVSGPNMATVYSDRGFGVRAPVVFYNRSNEAAAQLKPGDFDWDAIFKDGIRWFHSGGIFASLSQTTGEVIIEGMKAAKKAGAVCSFDVNFREKLWNVWGGEQKAADIIGRIVANVDVLVGDLHKVLGASGATVAPVSMTDPGSFSRLVDRVRQVYPQIKVVATTLRQVKSANLHLWSGIAWANGQTLVAPTCEVDIYDRVGSGDAFASGLFFGLLQGRPIAEALKLGWAHGALVSTTPGDITMVTLEQVEALAKGGSASIQR